MKKKKEKIGVILGRVVPVKKRVEQVVLPDEKEHNLLNEGKKQE